MTLQLRGLTALASLSLFALAACSQGTSSPAAATPAKTEQKTANNAIQGKPKFDYMIMEEFDTDMGKFVGLELGETFEQSKPKIDAVFTAYDGHAEPLDISTHHDTVEGDWKQVVATQDGLMDGTVAGHQLLAVYDENGALVTYGMRIKCHIDGGISKWQNTVC